MKKAETGNTVKVHSLLSQTLKNSSIAVSLKLYL